MRVKYCCYYQPPPKIITGKWRKLLTPEFEKPYFKKIEQFLESVGKIE